MCDPPETIEYICSGGVDESTRHAQRARGNHNRNVQHVTYNCSNPNSASLVCINTATRFAPWTLTLALPPPRQHPTAPHPYHIVSQIGLTHLKCLTDCRVALYSLRNSSQWPLSPLPLPQRLLPLPPPRRLLRPPLTKPRRRPRPRRLRHPLRAVRRRSGLRLARRRTAPTSTKVSCIFSSYSKHSAHSTMSDSVEAGAP